MKFKDKLMMAFAAMMITGTAQAGLMIRSIDMIVVETGFNSRLLAPDMSDEMALRESLTSGFIPAHEDADKLVCELSLEVFEGVSSSATCGGPRRDTGTLYTIRGTATGSAEMQFGLDWGRGGFLQLTSAGADPLVERASEDIWWSRSWSHGDVLDLIIPEAGDFQVLALGFEGCCDGSNSARWRSLPASGPAQWQTLAVNVPEPGILGLFSSGLFGSVLVRRRKMAFRQG